MARIHRESDKLTALEQTSGNLAVLAQLKQLVALNESLKAQEATFKASCIAQRDHLLTRLKQLTDPASTPHLSHLTDIEASHALESSKLAKLRATLASTNQSLARVQRLIDDNPTRAELLQFERRFVELYAMVAEKLGETKKFYALYNVLREVWEYTGNEKSLLESIIGQYPNASKTKQGKEAFVHNMEGIVGGVRRQSEVKERELEKERRARDELTQLSAQLMEKQRSYFRAVKAFQEECVRNERLTEMMEQQEAAEGGGGAGKQTNGEEEKGGGGEK